MKHYLLKPINLLILLVLLCNSILAQENFSSNFQTVCINQAVYFTPDNPTNGYTWQISPATGWSFTNGTNANSNYPVIIFSSLGEYDISLTKNGQTLLKKKYIKAVTSRYNETFKTEGVWNGTTSNPNNVNCINGKPVVDFYWEKMAALDFNQCNLEIKDKNCNVSGAAESPSSVCNIDGNELFFTSGGYEMNVLYSGPYALSCADCNTEGYGNRGRIINRHNKVMKGSENFLYMDAWGSRSTLSLPMPGSCESKYFIFTASYISNCNYTPTFAITNRKASYHIVDMNGDNGLGEVISKDNVFDQDINECIAAVSKPDNSGYWIILHDQYQNTFKVYELTSAGFNTTPVQTISIGLAIPSNPIGIAYYGDFKVSPDKSKLICYWSYDVNQTQFYRVIEIFDFNASTGFISNPQYPSNPFPVTNYTNSQSLRGIEFSPSSRFVYIGDARDNEIYRVDLYASNTLQTIPIPTPHSNELLWLELAPNGKILITSINSLYLGAIENPDAPLSSVTINNSYLPINPSLSTWPRKNIGLNHGTLTREILYEESLLNSTRLRYICPNSTINLSVNPTVSLSNTQWYSLKYGAIPGATGTTLTNISEAGIYYFKGTLSNGRNVHGYTYVKDYSTYDFGLKPSYWACPGGTVTITASYDICEAKTHRWYTAETNIKLLEGSAATTQTINLGKGKYYLEVETHSGCFLKYEFEVKEFDAATTIQGRNTSNCTNAPEYYTISNETGHTISTYQWNISPSGPTIGQANATSASITWTGANRSIPYTLSCKITIENCEYSISFNIHPGICCTQGDDQIYQSSYTLLDNTTHMPLTFDLSQPVAQFTGTNQHTYVLENITDNNSHKFNIIETDEGGEIKMVKQYINPENYTATDFTESVTNPNGKVVIGNAGNTLYVSEINPDGSLNSNLQHSFTIANTTGKILEATSIVSTYNYNGSPFGYCILVNVTNPSNQQSDIYLIGLTNTASGIWTWVRKMDFPNSNTKYHAHELIPVTDYAGTTTHTIILGRLTNGIGYKGFLMNTNIDATGNINSLPVTYVRDQIYFSGTILINNMGTPDRLVFGGSTSPESFTNTTDAAFLSTSLDLSITHMEKLVANYALEALSVAPSHTIGNTVALLFSQSKDNSNNPVPPYHYHLLELDNNLNPVNGIEALSNYANVSNDHQPYTCAKNLLSATPDNNYSIAGQEEGIFHLFIAKNKNTLTGKCDMHHFDVKTIDGKTALNYNISTSSVSIYTGTISPTLTTLGANQHCCQNDDREHTEIDPCEWFHAADVDVNFTPAEGTNNLNPHVSFDVIGSYNSSDIDYFEWDFADGSDPETTTGNHIEHDFLNDNYNYANYNITLIVHFKNGCTKSIINNIGIKFCDYVFETVNETFCTFDPYYEYTFIAPAALNPAPEWLVYFKPQTGGVYPPLPIGGGDVYNLAPGTYTFILRKPDGCIMLKKIVTINPPTIRSCNITKTLNCNSVVGISLLNNWFAEANCPECTAVGSTIEWTDITHNAVLGSGSTVTVFNNIEFQGVKQNPGTCEKCIITITVTANKPSSKMTIYSHFNTETSSCCKTYNFQQLLQLLNLYNPANCPGTITQLEIYDPANQITMYQYPGAPFASTFCPGTVYEISNPNSCCKMKLEIICTPGPDMITFELNGSPNQEIQTTDIKMSDCRVALFSIFPNPSSDIFNIHWNGSDPNSTYSLTVTDMCGKTVIIRNNLSTLTPESINMQGYAAGVYTLRIMMNEQLQTFKLIKQ